MTYATKCCTGEIKAQVSNLADFVIDIVAEQIQEKHVPNNVHKAAVQESITYKLPPMPPVGNEHKLHGPAMNRYRYYLPVYKQAGTTRGQQENNYIDND